MLRVFLERFLTGSSGFATVGVPIRLGGQPRLLFAKVANILSDGDGIRLCWGWKGASSLKPCFKHFNVFKRDSDLATRNAGYVEIDCADLAQLREWTAADVHAAADLLAEAKDKVEAGTMPKVRMEELEKSIGINANRLGMLMSPTLRFHASVFLRPCRYSLEATPSLSPFSESVA